MPLPQRHRQPLPGSARTRGEDSAKMEMLALRRTRCAHVARWAPPASTASTARPRPRMASTAKRPARWATTQWH
eukprot:13326080-Alexandrium_andersonii.AAC.1